MGNSDNFDVSDFVDGLDKNGFEPEPETQDGADD